MSEATSVDPTRAAASPGRPWWRWIVGFGLIAAAAWHYFGGSTGTAGKPRLTVPFARPSVSAAMSKVDALPAAPGALAGCNLLLVTLDTTRIDRIGCYGNDRIETPNLDRLAADGVIFSQALATAPTTLPSHASLLTGLYPCHHGARVNGLFHLDEAHQTLAEILSASGYATAAVVSTFVLDARFGLAQGFEHYDDDLSGGPEAVLFMYEERLGQQTTDRALRWLEGVTRTPFFLWVHYYDPHAPYAPASPYAERYPDNRYDGEIALVDQQVGRLLAALDDRNWTDDTLVVVVGDHGEGLRSQNEQMHGYLVQEATMRIPLIMRCPGRLDGGRHLAGLVSQVDLMPTIGSLLGVAGPAGMDGLDLTQGVAGNRAVFGETLMALMIYGWAPLATVYQDNFKYIHGPNPELYDVSNDPRETHNLLQSRPEVASRLRSRLAELFGPDLDAALNPSPVRRVSPEERARLAALGYFVGGAGDVAPIASRPDPRSRLPLLDSVEQVLATHIGVDRLDEAIEYLKRIGREHADFLPAFKYLGHLCRERGRLDEAETAYRQCLRIRPNIEEFETALAETLASKGNTAEAVAVYERLATRDPEAFSVRRALGALLLDEDRPADAIRHLQAAFELDPKAAGCVKDLVRAFVGAGRGAELHSLLTSTLEEDPRLPMVRSVLADLLGQEQRFAEAEALLRTGAELMPNDPDAVAMLARFLVQCPAEDVRSPVEGVALMERVCQQTEYKDAVALYRLGLVYSAVGRFAEATGVARKARSLAVETGRDDLLEAIDALLSSRGPDGGPGQ